MTERATPIATFEFPASIIEVATDLGLHTLGDLADLGRERLRTELMKRGHEGAQLRFLFWAVGELLAQAGLQLATSTALPVARHEGPPTRARPEIPAHWQEHLHLGLRCAVFLPRGEWGEELAWERTWSATIDGASVRITLGPADERRRPQEHLALIDGKRGGTTLWSSPWGFYLERLHVAGELFQQFDAVLMDRALGAFVRVTLSTADAALTPAALETGRRIAHTLRALE